MTHRHFFSVPVTSLLLILAAGSATAGPIDLPGGPLHGKFKNAEQVDVTGANGIDTTGFSNLDLDGDGTPDLMAGDSEGNWGIFQVTTLASADPVTVTPHVPDFQGGAPFYEQGDPNRDILGIFYGVNLTSSTTATNGWVDLYWFDADVIASPAGQLVTNRTDWNDFNFDGPTLLSSGDFLARLALTPGIIDGDGVTTLISTLPITGSPPAGSIAQSYGDVLDINNDGVIDSLDGAWAGQLNTDWFFVDVNGNGTSGEVGERRDFFFQNGFARFDQWDSVLNQNIQGLTSEDPFRANAVPEPTSAALLGLGLLALGSFVIRRRARRTKN